jgi:ABC-type transport system involved in multi-copper enzyme maturation permease subunit
MSHVLTIALATFKEAVRARVFLYLLVVAAALIAGSVPAAELGIGEEMRLVTDVSVAGATYVCVFLAIFLGVSAVSGEVERRTVYTIIAKSASRSQFVLGKFFGVWATVTVGILASYAMIISLVSVLSRAFVSELFAPMVMAIMEMGLLVALATFFSCISKPLLSSGFTVSLYLTGVSLKSLMFWVSRSPSQELVWLTKALYRLLPNFQLYDVRTNVVHHLTVSPETFAWSALYTVTYGAVLLLLACVVFHRRDLK